MGPAAAGQRAARNGSGRAALNQALGCDRLAVIAGGRLAAIFRVAGRLLTHPTDGTHQFRFYHLEETP